MKAIQILTQESIEKIEKAIKTIERLSQYEDSVCAYDSINDLKEIIKDVNS